MALRQRAGRVWGMRRMEGWSGNLRLDGYGMAVHQDPSRLVLAPGSALSDAEVMECICPPWEKEKVNHTLH